MVKGDSKMPVDRGPPIAVNEHAAWRLMLYHGSWRYPDCKFKYEWLRF
jgi:hypothetical protein